MSYPKETKIALVKEYEQGKTVATISKDKAYRKNVIFLRSAVPIGSDPIMQTSPSQRSY